MYPTLEAVIPCDGYLVIDSWAHTREPVLYYHFPVVWLRYAGCGLNLDSKLLHGAGVYPTLETSRLEVSRCVSDLGNRHLLRWLCGHLTVQHGWARTRPWEPPSSVYTPRTA